MHENDTDPSDFRAESAFVHTTTAGQFRDLTFFASGHWVREELVSWFTDQIRAYETRPNELIHRNEIMLASVQGGRKRVMCVRMPYLARAQVRLIADQKTDYGQIWAAAEVAAEMRYASR